LPILLPIIFDKDFEFHSYLYGIQNNYCSNNYENIKNNLETDFAAKQNLKNFIIKDCVINIKMSQVKEFIAKIIFML
jgi:hypothetical protein